jgi:ATP synthase protein I
VPIGGPAWCNSPSMADDGAGNDGNASGGGGKGALGDLVKAESMIQLALALPAGCVIGWLGGSWLDHHFHQSWIAVVGILLGAAAGFVQIFRTASRYIKRG